MDIASPLSVLDRMRPESAAQRAQRALSSGAAATTDQLRQDRTQSSAGPKPASGEGTASRGSGFAGPAGQIGRSRPDQSSDSEAANRPGSPPPPPPPFDAPSGAGVARSGPTPPSADVAASARSSSGAPSDPGHGPDRSFSTSGSAEMVVRAGLDGLDLLAGAGANRLAASLAQSAYSVLRTLI